MMTSSVSQEQIPRHRKPGYLSLGRGPEAEPAGSQWDPIPPITGPQYMPLIFDLPKAMRDGHFRLCHMASMSPLCLGDFPLGNAPTPPWDSRDWLSARGTAA